METSPSEAILTAVCSIQAPRPALSTTPRSILRSVVVRRRQVSIYKVRSTKSLRLWCDGVEIISVCNRSVIDNRTYEVVVVHYQLGGTKGMVYTMSRTLPLWLFRLPLNLERSAETENNFIHAGLRLE